jgi:PAS domain-containing protein
MSLDHKTVVLIDDNPDHAHALEDGLITSGSPQSSVEWFRTLSSGLKRVSDRAAGVIFLNLFLPDSRGVETLDKLLSVIPASSVIVLASADEEAICKTAMAHGAQDYLLEGHIDTYAFARALRGIEEREEARRALFGEKERAQVTLNSIGDAVLSTDMGNVTYLNVVAEHMTGWSCVEAVGQPLSRGVSNHRRRYARASRQIPWIWQSRKTGRGAERRTASWSGATDMKARLKTPPLPSTTGMARSRGP